MKISGPRPPDVGGVSPTDATPEAKVESAAPTTPTAAADPVGALAADMAAGRISPTDAVARLLDLATGTGPLAGLAPAEQARLRDALAEILADDPGLQARLRRLGL